MRKALIHFLVLCVLGSTVTAATTKRSSAKKPVSAKSRATKSKTASTSRRSSGKTTAARNRKTSAPRQTQPTAERYTEIQQALADRGFYTGPVDGNWNSECVEALKRFQADQHLSPDGKLGSLSIIALGLGPRREANQALLAKPEPAQ